MPYRFGSIVDWGDWWCSSEVGWWQVQVGEVWRQDREVEPQDLSVYRRFSKGSEAASTGSCLGRKVVCHRVAVTQSTEALEAMNRDHVWLWSEVDALYAAVALVEGVSWDFMERLWTGYSGLMRTHATMYRNQLDAVLSDAQLKGEYFKACNIRVGKEDYWLRIYEPTSD